ncbi:hypothetical protein [Spiroplasma endosymbiont of Nebria brevicollis]|uniref:hypothetical protein n=1 Tax=Spiroplasma endosymbiont of Nebria brevicollis TaxID=3066284 RepID=UPI00313E7260
MNEKVFALKQKLRPHKFLGSQYFILTFFWLIFIGLLMTALILFLQERAQIKIISWMLQKLVDINNY